MNIPPANPPTPRLRRERAGAWLRNNDPEYATQKIATKRKKQRAARQAAKNPALVGRYMRAMLKI